MILGTKGIEFYPYYVTPVNYYESVSALYDPELKDCYRFVFIEEGKGDLNINDKRISILPFTILCLNGNDSVTNLNCTVSRMSLLCFLPSAINIKLTMENVVSNDGLTISDSQDKHFLLPFIYHNDTYTELKYINLETGTRIKYLLEHLKEQLLVQSDSWPCLSRSFLLELLFLIERTYSIRKFENTNPKRFSVDEVLLYLHNNYWKKITISNLTKKFSTNQTTLSKEFKAVTGQTIIQYILKMRVLVAAGMLRDTTLKIELIIERVGFHNVTQFNKVFKEYHECLPHEYRKRFKPY